MADVGQSPVSVGPRRPGKSIPGTNPCLANSRPTTPCHAPECSFCRSNSRRERSRPLPLRHGNTNHNVRCDDQRQGRVQLLCRHVLLHVEHNDNIEGTLQERPIVLLDHIGGHQEQHRPLRDCACEAVRTIGERGSSTSNCSGATRPRCWFSGGGFNCPHQYDRVAAGSDSLAIR